MSGKRIKNRVARCVFPVVLLVVGCDKSTSSTSSAKPFGPSIKRLREQEAVLEELLGLNAYVYEFSGAFLELWLEGEVEDAKTEEKELLPSFGPVTVSRERFEGRTGSIAERLKGKIVVWEENGRAAIGLRVSADLPGAASPASLPVGGTTAISGESSISIAPTPKESSLSGSGGRGSEIPDVVELPRGTGEEFTIFWYAWEEHQTDPESRETIASRIITVRLKGRLLAEEVPEFRNEPDDSAAVAALENLDASVQRYDNGSVRSIYFGESNAVTDDDLAHLRGLPNLASLEIHSPTVTDAGLEHLKTLTTLKELNLHGTKVTDAGLAHLKDLTGAKLEDLKTSTTLKELNLHGTDVTDAGLAHLQDLTGLRTLILHETKVTHAGVEELKQALPQCTIMGAPAAPEADPDVPSSNGEVPTP